LKAVGVRDLPGVGRVIADKLKHNHFTETCEDLQNISLQTLKQDLGMKTGQSLYNLCRGIDDKSKLEYDEERKSVSAEINYGIRFLKIEEAEKFLFQLCTEVVRRLHDVSPESNLTARQLTLKAMLRSADAPVETRKFMGHGICDSFSKSANFSWLTNDVDVIKREVSVLLQIILKSNNRQISDLRGLGIQLSKLEKSSKKMPSILSFMKKNVERATSRPIEGSSEEYKDGRSLQKKDLEQNKIETNNLSLSQIDPDALDSLPNDIKEEILQNIKSNNVKDHSKISTINGPSNLEIANKHLNISFSEFDPNVLNELPIELQQELRAQFSSKPQLTSTGFDRIMRKTSIKQSTDQCSNIRSKKSNKKRTFNKSPKDFKQNGNNKARAICKTSPPKAKQTLLGHN
jgi:DNA repair protein REV1